MPNLVLFQVIPAELVFFLPFLSSLRFAVIAPIFWVVGEGTVTEGVWNGLRKNITNGIYFFKPTVALVQIAKEFIEVGRRVGR